jgi:hypothetical protein
VDCGATKGTSEFLMAAELFEKKTKLDSIYHHQDKRRKVEVVEVEVPEEQYVNNWICLCV